MWQKISAGAFFLVAVMFCIAMWNEIVPMPIWILCLSVFAIFFHFGIYFFLGEQNQTAKRLLSITLSLYLAMLIPSFIYYRWEKWGFGNFVSSSFIMKILLLFFVFGVIYLQYVMTKAKTTYKRKRENERIRKTKENFHESPLAKMRNSLRKKNKKIDDDPANAIQLTLGESAEKE